MKQANTLMFNNNSNYGRIMLGISLPVKKTFACYVQTLGSYCPKHQDQLDQKKKKNGVRLTEIMLMVGGVRKIISNLVTLKEQIC